MNIEDAREYCLSKAATSESFPFDDTTLVFKVLDKMFALISLRDERQRINLKCDPDRAILLREEYPDFIYAGYHMSKKHWNTILLDSELSSQVLYELIDHSYDLVISKMTKKNQAIIQEINENEAS